MIQNSPLISIVTPMYNAEKYIEETIESVISQSYQNWEMIIVNNASTDRSLELIDGIKDNRIRIITLSKNSGGPAKPRNIGLEDAKGEYIAFLDADDLWTSDKLQRQLEYMLQHNINFSSTGKTNINEDSQEINFKASILNSLSFFNKRETICDFIQYRFIFTSSVIIKKELMVRFNEDKKMVAVEDFCAWLEVFNHPLVKFKYIKHPLLKYRILNTSISERHIEYKQATKAYLCVLNFIYANKLFDYGKCFAKMCFRDMSLNFLENYLKRK